MRGLRARYTPTMCIPNERKQASFHRPPQSPEGISYPFQKKYSCCQMRHKSAQPAGSDATPSINTRRRQRRSRSSNPPRTTTSQECLEARRGPADPRGQPHPTPQRRPLAAVPARPPHTPQRCLQVRSRRAATVPQLGATSVASGHAYMPSPAAADASAARLRFSSMTGPKT